jgi:asparagine synthase (glutamine-hydrolysing)
MCGIAGIAGPGAHLKKDRVERMLDSLAHRGPDDRGLAIMDDCVLGHVRLSIVDLESGQQPMESPDGRYTVTFNGEIYGFLDLRDSLEGHAFRTSSDTEVVLAFHERHGAKGTDRLPGMFAYAIWDRQERTLLLSRDRLGEKPLFYAWGPSGEFLFASEIKAILASGLVSPSLRPEGLAGFLERGYVSPDMTIYREVEVLKPAHQLLFRGGRVEIRRYWTPPPIGEPVAMEAAVDEFKERFQRAVSRQLVASVPVGVLLSGGLDSSSVVATAARLQPGIRTFSFGIGGSDDELPYSRDVAARFQTDHTEIRAGDIDVHELLLKMAEIHDEPFADSSALPTYVVAGLARSHVKVALGGDGGDELLAGYWYMPPLFDMESESGAPYWKWLLVRLLHRLAQGDKKRALGHRIRGMDMRRRHGSVTEALAARHRVFREDEVARLGFPTPPPRPMPSGGGLEVALRDDIEDYLPGSILVKTDRSSMAHGLELRAPFLDVELASFLLALPHSLKIGRPGTKLLLRSAMAGTLPDAIRSKKKQGFGGPIEEWLRLPKVEELRKEILGNPLSALRTLLPGEGVDSLAAGDFRKTWTLLNLGIWLEARRGSIR